MIQVGIMGGTFDPIHYGHLLAAESAREANGLDEVWFIPTHQPPLKSSEPMADPAARLEMVYRAIDFQPHFRALDIELERGGVSYTYDTVAALQELYPGREFHIILGADRVNELPQWHRIEELAQQVRFIALQRPDVDMQLEQLPDYLQARIRHCEMPQIGISSTEIRNRQASGQSIRFLLPDKVYQLIKRNGLYAT